MRITSLHTSINVPTNRLNTYFQLSVVDINLEGNLWEQLEGRWILDKEFVKEIQEGYLRTFKFQCTIYSFKQNISSEGKCDNSKDMNINIAFVCATVNTGQGQSQLGRMPCDIKCAQYVQQNILRSSWKHLFSYE